MSDQNHPVPGHPAPGAEVPPGSTHGHTVPEQYESGHHAGHEHHGDHGIGKYVKVFLFLCVLTGASFFTYSEAWPFHGQPAVGWAFMMAVSCTKALLVMLFFMHLKYEADWKYVLTIPASIMSIFLVLALIPDIGLRVGGEKSLYHYSDARLQRVGELQDTANLEAAAKDPNYVERKAEERGIPLNKYLKPAAAPTASPTGTPSATPSGTPSATPAGS